VVEEKDMSWDCTIRQFSRVIATFRPKDIASLKPEGMADIGKRGVFEAMWLITEEDNEQYAGQWAMSPVRNPRDFECVVTSGNPCGPLVSMPLPDDIALPDSFSFVWCPFEDLQEIGPVRRTAQNVSL
jgi:hypothetical protein